MAWSSGHTHEATMSVPATSDGALSDYTYLFTEADFNAADLGALADAFAADDVECSEDSSGTVQLAIDVIDVDTVADTFILRVGPTDTSAVSAQSLYWRYGSTTVSQTGTAAYPADLVWYAPDGGNVNRVGTNGTLNGGMTAGGATGPNGWDATDFDGTDDEIDAGLFNELNGVSGFTTLGWVNVDVVEDNDIFVSDWNGLGDGHVLCRMGGGGEAEFFVNNPTQSGGTLTPATALSAAAGWQFVAFVFDSGTRTAYIDGTSASGSGGGATLTSTNTNPLWIGNSPHASSSLIDAQMADWSIYSAARSAAWVATEYDRSNTLGQATTGAFTAIGGGGGTTILSGSLALLGCGM